MRSIETSVTTEELLEDDSLQYDKERLEEELSLPIYGKSFCKYVLLKLELLESENNVEKKYEVLSIEHILPQRPSEDSEWVRSFSYDDRNIWTDDIANLILLSRRKNSAARNYNFEIKKTQYFRDRISDLSRSHQILNYNEWNVDVLTGRKENIIRLLSNVSFEALA